MLSGVSSTAQNISQRCLHFERGHCRRGSSCRYLHIIETTSNEQLEDESVSIQHRPLAKGRNVESSVKPCRHFLHTGRCAFGTTCRFAHFPLPTAAICSRGEDAEDVKPEDAKLVAGDEEKPEKRSKDKRKPCWFFKCGRCHFGERCRQLHVKADGVTVNGQRDSVKQQGKVGQIDQTCSHKEEFESQQKQRDGATDRETDNVPSCTQERNGASSESTSLTQTVDETQDKQTDVDELKRCRTIEVKQLVLRYPQALITETEDGCTTAKFVFEPSDPDWVQLCCKFLSFS